MTDDLTWDHQVSNVLLPALSNRVRTLKMMTRYLDDKFKRIYANSIFKSKLMFGIETWGGAKKSLIRKVQILQDKVTKLSLPKEAANKSNRQRLILMDWLPIKGEVEAATHSMTYKILNWNKPQEILSVMPKNDKNLRIVTHVKLATKPRWLGRTAVSRAGFRNRSYLYNTLSKDLTTQKTLKKFKKSLKVSMMKKINQESWT